MRVTPDMIDKQLRFKGKLMSKLVRYNSPKNCIKAKTVKK